MTKEEKEVYAAVFKAALILSKNQKKIDFAIDILKAIKDLGEADEETFTVCWNFLKENADMENTDDNWFVLVNRKLVSMCEGQSKIRRRMLGNVVDEVNRRVGGAR